MNITIEYRKWLDDFKLSHPFVGPQKTIGDVQLSAKQYQRFNELVGSINVSGRKNLIQTLDKQIKSKRYARLADMAEINQTRSSDDGRDPAYSTRRTAPP